MCGQASDGDRRLEVPWKRRRGSRKRTCLDNTRNHVSERELSGDETQ